MHRPTPAPAGAGSRPVQRRRPAHLGRARTAVPVGLALLHLLLVAGAARAGEPVPRWSWPLAGPHAVSNHFAPPATRYAAGHRGADLPGPIGAPVRASGAGRVAYAGLLAGRGVVVVVHGDLRTTYEPVTAVVPVGADVEAGEPIGRLEPGHEGCLVTACLHWGLRRGEDYLDPVALVERGPARLLPLGRPAPATGPLRDAGPSASEPVAPGTSLAGDAAASPPAGSDAPGPPMPARPGAEPVATQVAAREVSDARAGTAAAGIALVGQAHQPATASTEHESSGRDRLAVSLALAAVTALGTGSALARGPSATWRGR